MNVVQIMQMLTQMKSNPAEFLSQYGIPKEMANDPQAIIQSLMNTGRITQDQYNQAMKMAQQMGAKFN